MNKPTKIDLDLTQLNNWLSSFINFKRRPEDSLLNLQTTRIICEKLGHPEKYCPCFHVTGSKGKGTISANIASALTEAGFKTGVHASPHVLHFVERTSTGREPFSMDVYDKAFGELKSGVEELIQNDIILKNNITWHELTTIFSMLCFRIAKVDYAVFEVGMGGRLDPTNVITPLCSVFGPIELEHTKFLGDTLEKIATEKAGIIKPKIPAVSVWQKPCVRETLEKIAIKNETNVEFVPFLENYLEQDAAVAKLALERSGIDLTETQIENGISKVKLPGRYEMIKSVPNYPNIPYLLIDVAHTENSMAQVCKRIVEERLSGNLIFGCALGKNVNSMARIITGTGVFKNIYVTKPGDFKKSSLSQMEQAFDDTKVQYKSNEDFKSIIKQALKDANDTKTPLFVLGSFYLAGEVKKILGC